MSTAIEVLDNTKKNIVPETYDFTDYSQMINMPAFIGEWLSDENDGLF